MPGPSPDPEGLTVSSRIARGLLAYAVSQGADRDALLAASGLDPDRLADVEGRIPAERHGRLWRAAAEANGDPDFGLRFGAGQPPNDVSLVGFVVMSAPTLGDAYDDLARYFTLFSEGVSLRLGAEAGAACLELRPSGASYFAEAPRHPTECVLASLAGVAPAVTGRRLPGLHVAFAHDRPPTGTAGHERVLGVVPTFGAEVARLTFDAAALAWPNENASPQLHAILRHDADEILEGLHPSIPQRVARAVAERFHGGVPTLAQVAADLTIGERSLQRHLEEEGVTFLGVVNDVRRQMALRYLEDGRSTLHEIAFSLGYSEPSAFHRAFKRWTGVTAGAYREQREAAQQA